MEIINLLILVIVYYTLYCLEFYQKILLLFGSCMGVSFFINYNICEENKDDNLIYYMLDYVVHIFTYIYNFTIDMSNILFQFTIVSTCYGVLEDINSYYLVGRNKIFQKLSKVAFNSFLQIQSSKLNRQPITRVQENVQIRRVQDNVPITRVQDNVSDVYVQNRDPFTSLQNMSPYVPIQNKSPRNKVEYLNTYVHVKNNETFKDSLEINTFLDELIDKKNS